MIRSHSLALCFFFIVLLLSPAFATQQITNTPAPQTPSVKAKTKSSEAQPDEGTIGNGVYSEKFFYLHYQIPQGWTVKTQEMRQGVQGAENAMVLLSAFAKQTPDPGQINPSVIITAERAGASAEIKTPDDYLESLTQLVTSKGFSVLNPPGQINIAGVDFLRSDFQKQEGDVTTYQATMVALRRGYFLQITAISGNEEQLTPLLNGIQIFAPPTMKRP
jgi:hypothetical protein